VYSNMRTEVTLFAPDVERLTINGIDWPFTRSGDHITFGYREPIRLPFVVNKADAYPSP